MKTKLTKRTVDAARPGDRDAFLWDTDVPGFGLKVTALGKALPDGKRNGGQKVYIFQYRLNGRQRRYRIGRHGAPWTLDKARKEAFRLLGLIVGGKDPADIRHEARHDLTVTDLCDLYLAEGVTTKKASTVAMDRSRIDRHVKPLLGRRRVRSITRADIEKLMRDVAAGRTARNVKTGFRGRSIVTGGKGVAARTVGMLGGIFRFAVDRGMRKDNPVHGVKRFPDRKNDRFLSVAELAQLGDALAAAEQEGENVVAIAAIRLLALTGCRRNEVLLLRWENVDFERSVLRLSESKTGAKVVPLGAPALQVLSSLPHLDGCPYVFPSAITGGPFVGLQKVWERVRKRAKLSSIRLHDLRHSFAAVGAASGDSLIVIGALLGHRNQGSTARYAHLNDNPVQDAANRISKQIAEAMNNGKNSNADVLKLRK